MDDDLARRLAALRHSLETKSTVEHITQDSGLPSDNEDALVSRFKEIFKKSPVSESGAPGEKSTTGALHKYQQEIPFQELIGALSPKTESWTVDGINESQFEELLADATTPKLIQESRAIKGAFSDVVSTRLQYNLSDDKSDTEAEGDILRLIKDEIEFERAHGITTGDDHDHEGKSGEIDQRRSSTPKKIELDDDLRKRFEALERPEFPSIPKINSPKNPSISLNSLVTESDTWCCICNEDAEYRCSGCENDIYCTSCLYEAHTGPNAGYEERRHKWTKYTKPKKLALC